MSDQPAEPGLKRWVKWLAVLSASLLLLLLLVLWGLLGSHQGNRWLLAVATSLEPRLTVTLASGTLLGDATFTNLGWSSQGLEIRIPQLDWRWDLSCLKQKTLCLDLLRARGGRVIVTRVAEATAPAETAAKGDFRLPFAIELRSVQLEQTRVEVFDHTFTAAELQGAARLDTQGLQVSALQLRELLIAIAVAAPAETTDRSGPGAAAGPVTLPEVRLPLAIRLDGVDLHAADLHIGNNVYRIERLRLSAEAAGSQMTASNFELTTPQGTLQGQGRIDLTGGYPLAVTARGKLLELPPLTDLEADVRVDGSIADLLVELEVRGPVTGRLEAEGRLLEPDLPFSAELSWQNFGWPIRQPTLISESGQAVIHGSLDGFKFELRGDARGEKIPPLTVTARGDGDARHLQLASVRLDLLSGSADLSGSLGWGEAFSWQGNLTWQHINPGEWIKAYPGQISGRLESAFVWRDGEWQLRLPQLTVEGELAGQQLRLQGAVQGNQAGDWQVSQLQLLSGTNRLQVDGQLGGQNRLQGELAIVDLQTSIPQAAGTASGTFTLSGPKDALQLDFTLQANGLAHAGKQLEALEAGGQLTLAAVPQGAVRITAQGLVYQEFTVAQLEAAFDGDSRSHTLTLAAEGEPFSVQSRVAGTLDGQRWSGQLQESRVLTPIGPWRLEAPLALRYDLQQQQAEIAAHCWSAEAGRLCLNETARVGRAGGLNLALHEFAAAQLAPLLPQGFVWQGELAATATAEWAPGQKPLLRLDLNAGSGRFEIAQAGQAVTGDYQQLALNLALDATEARAELLLRSEQFGQAEVSLQLAPYQKDHPLLGNFKLSGLQLAMLQPLFAPLEEIAGIISANGTLAGSLNRPEVTAEIDLRDGRVAGASLPTTIEQVQLVIQLDKDRGTLAGNLNLGGAQADLAGAFSWEQLPATGWLTLTGSRHRFMFGPELTLMISPDIRLELQEKKLVVTGRIGIPYGRIKIRTLPKEAVRVSEDVVILDDPQSASKKRILPLTLELEVTVQDDVEIDAFGLEAELEGNLAIRQAVNKPLFGNGSIDLKNGTYRAFGQNLLINKGFLLFSGPLSSPYIDVDAIRDPQDTRDNVIAGIRLRGEAQKPKVTIYSEPAMSQQEAISYLLRGRSLGSGSGSSEDAIVASMLIGAGLGQTEGTLAEIGQALGVKDLAVETSGSGSDTQVNVSGYILPGVQVGYGVGVFSPVAVVTLRYEVLPRLILEAVTGLRSAVDLLYEFEF